MDFTTKIIQGDCIEAMRDMDAGSVHLVFADPPYNIGVDYGKGAKADSLPEHEYLLWCSRWIYECSRVLVDRGSLWVLISSKLTWRMAEALESALPLHQYIIWRETFGTYQQKRFAQGHRILLWGSQSSNPTFYPNAIRVPSARQTKYNDKRANPAGRVPDDVWEVSRLCGTHTSERVDWHPAQLRQWPLERIVKACTKPGDTVLDPFCGSASMGVVCKKLDRSFIGIEIKPEYCEMARTRIANPERLPPLVDAPDQLIMEFP